MLRWWDQLGNRRRVYKQCTTRVLLSRASQSAGDNVLLKGAGNDQHLGRERDLPQGHLAPLLAVVPLWPKNGPKTDNAPSVFRPRARNL